MEATMLRPLAVLVAFVALMISATKVNRTTLNPTGMRHLDHPLARRHPTHYDWRCIPRW